jgi:hypothetical protein
MEKSRRMIDGMALIEPKGRPHVFCPKCGANVVWPTELTDADKKLIATEVRSSSLAGARMAASQFGLDPREAKALAFHITRQCGECHRCRSPLQEDAVVCGQCRSANLDW